MLLSKPITRFSAVYLANLFATGVWLAALFLVTSCRSDVSNTGLAELPPGHLVDAGLIDTLSVTLETRIKGRVRTDNRSYQLLGSVLDPEFGRISADMYTELLPTAANLSFGDTSKLRLDSAVLKIRLAGYYGRGEDAVRLHVRVLTEALPDSTLFSDRVLSSGEEIAAPVTVTVTGTGSTQNVSFHLTDAFANKLLKADSVNLVDDDAFRAFIPGLKFSAEAPALISREPGAMLVVQNSYTAILLYYSVKNDTTGEYENAPVYPQGFVAGGSANCYHSIKRDDYEWRTFGLEANNAANTYEFLQAGSLVNLFCKIPDLSKLSRITVHKAELFLQADSTLFGSRQTSGYRYNPPSALTIFNADSLGNMLFDEDGRAEVLISTVSYDSDRKGYPISMTSLTQAIINAQTENNGIIIVPKDSSTSIGRAAIFGTGSVDPDKKPKISIYYSTIP